MRLLYGASVLVTFSLAAGCSRLGAQSAESLADRLRAAEQGSAIDAAGVAPWHLKLDVQLFDAKGKPSEQGTIEEWWLGKNFYKVTYTFPSYSSTEVRNRDGAYRTKDQSAQPGVLLDVLNQVVHPINLGDLDSTKPDLRKEKFGKLEEDCLMLDQPLKTVAYPPLGLFPTYCLDSGKDDLRVSTELGSITFIRNRVGRFQNRSVAVDLSGVSQGVTTVSAHVSSLSGTKLTEADFQPSPEMATAGLALVRMSGGMMAGAIVKKVPPVYPYEAKLHHVEGAVVLHAIIGTDGHVHSLHIVSTPDSDLAMAAIAAVKQWTYKPYLLNGLPTEVDTTVTVNFAFGPG